jgi:hypothetical protein
VEGLIRATRAFEIVFGENAKDGKFLRLPLQLNKFFDVQVPEARRMCGRLSSTVRQRDNLIRWSAKQFRENVAPLSASKIIIITKDRDSTGRGRISAGEGKLELALILEETASSRGAKPASRATRPHLAWNVAILRQIYRNQCRLAPQGQLQRSLPHHVSAVVCVITKSSIREEKLMLHFISRNFRDTYIFEVSKTGLMTRI